MRAEGWLGIEQKFPGAITPNREHAAPHLSNWRGGIGTIACEARSYVWNPDLEQREWQRLLKKMAAVEAVAMP
jgi:hypothetical protein